MNTHTPKHFVIQLGSLAALYVSIASLLVLLFATINIQFPDTAWNYWEGENGREAIRTSIAVLVVFFPAYLVLTRISNQHRRTEAGGKYTVLTRWLVFLSLLVAGAAMLVDLVVLINYALEGELTKRFLLKVFALLAVVGLAFHYYILDVRGYFTKRKDKALYFAMGAVVIVVSSVLFGFAHIETPAKVREIKIDQTQVENLRDIQWTLESYVQKHDTLPTSLEEVYGADDIPAAPEGRAAYTYNMLEERKYELCATFAYESENNDSRPHMVDANYNWEHSSGQECFVRTIESTQPLKF